MRIDRWTPQATPGSDTPTSIGADSSVGYVIREGHLGLVATFREFARDLDTVEDELPDREVTRATIAFLRQSLLPFAQWEDRHPGGCTEVAEDTAFEHAFLNAEVDALAVTLTELDRTAEPGRAVQRMRKCLHRIEAVLELHVQKAADRAATAPRSPAL